MNIQCPPLYFTYLTQDQGDLFFDTIWKEKRKSLSFEWVSGEYSKHYDNDDFPLFAQWPQEWISAYHECEKLAGKKLEKELEAYEYYEIGKNELWIDDDEEKVYFSTQTYCYGQITEMTLPEDSEYDSTVTAAYIFKNEYAEWEEKFGNKYNAIKDIPLSKPFTDSLVGFYNECDGCGSYGLIVSESEGAVLCASCQNSLQS